MKLGTIWSRSHLQGLALLALITLCTSFGPLALAADHPPPGHGDQKTRFSFTQNQHSVEPR